MFQQNEESKKNNILRGFKLESDLEKSRSGTYKDTSENRSKKRVGEQYGSKKAEDTKSEKTKKTEDVKDEKTKKTEDQSKDTKSKKKDEKSTEKKTVNDHAKDTPDEDLKNFIDNADENTDPEQLAAAEKELESRSREDKSPSELELMKIEKEIAGLQQDIDDAIEIYESMSNETFKENVYDSIEDGDAEMAKLKEKAKKIKEKIKKEKQPKIEKKPEDFAKVASVDELSKKASELSKESVDAMKDGNYTKAQKLNSEAQTYIDAMNERLGLLNKPEKKSELQEVEEESRNEDENPTSKRLGELYIKVDAIYEKYGLSDLDYDDYKYGVIDKLDKIPIEDLKSAWSELLDLSIDEDDIVMSSDKKITDDYFKSPHLRSKYNKSEKKTRLSASDMVDAISVEKSNRESKSSKAMKKINKLSEKTLGGWEGTEDQTLDLVERARKAKISDKELETWLRNEFANADSDDIDYWLSR